MSLPDRMTLADWQRALRERGVSAAEFRCPQCGNVTSLAEWQYAGLEPQAAPQECIGRHVRGIGCLFAAYGLIPGPRVIVFPDGSEQRVFRFADEGADTPQPESTAEDLIRQPQRFARLCAVIGYPDQQVIDTLVSRGVDRETAERAVEETYSRYASQEADVAAADQQRGDFDPTANEE